MKVQGCLRMAFGPSGHRVIVDNLSQTNVRINGNDPFVSDSDGSGPFDRSGWWITPTFRVGQSLRLSVPSGMFEGAIISVNKMMEDQSSINSASALGQLHQRQALELQVVVAQGQWDGKQGGINSFADGGLSGLGGFEVIDVTLVEGTFGKAASLAEYNDRVRQYRSQYYTVDDTGQCSLTERGEQSLTQYISQFALDLEYVAGHTPYDWGTTPIQYALSQVRFANEFNNFNGLGLSGWVNLANTEIPCIGSQNPNFRSWRQWLDLQYK